MQENCHVLRSWRLCGAQECAAKAPLFPLLPTVLQRFFLRFTAYLRAQQKDQLYALWHIQRGPKTFDMIFYNI